jgi:hypothetical protein
MDDRSEYLRPRYDFRTVCVLLGLKEGKGFGGKRHVTLVDLLSWARDPGGDHIWQHLAAQEPDGWTARRGPLAPDSELACVLWDLLAAVRMLTLREKAIVALKAFGFTTREIGEAMHVSHTEIRRTLWGEQERPGVVQRVHRHMNGGTDE